MRWDVLVLPLVGDRPTYWCEATPQKDVIPWRRLAIIVKRESKEGSIYPLL